MACLFVCLCACLSVCFGKGNVICPKGNFTSVYRCMLENSFSGLFQTTAEGCR